MRHFAFLFVLVPLFVGYGNAHGGITAGRHASDMLPTCDNALCAQADSRPSSDELQTDAVDPKLAAQCGMFIRTPRLRNLYGQLLGFGCAGSYKDGNHAGMGMDFQYDPNQNAGGEHVEFDI